MHWRLSTTEAFSLRRTIRNSSWMLHAPFHTTHTGNQLLRIERIANEKTVAAVVTQNNRNLLIHSASNLNGSEIEELTKRTRRILRLGESFKPFYNLVETHPLQIRSELFSPAILRGATLFEDVIRATALVWNVKGQLDANKYTWLVDHFGDPLPSNPTLHAFPEPAQILDDQHAVSEQLQPSMGNAILHVANIFETQAHKIGSILDSSISSLTLSEELRHLLHLDETPLSQVMLSLGRYDYIPTDPLARERWNQYVNLDVTSSSVDIIQHFETWQPWGGLVYWLWDWAPITEMNILRND